MIGRAPGLRVLRIRGHHGTRRAGATCFAAAFLLGFITCSEVKASGFTKTNACPDAEYASPRQQWFDGWPWYHPQWIPPNDDRKNGRKQSVAERPSWCAVDWPDAGIPRAIRDHHRSGGGFLRIEEADCIACVQLLPSVIKFATEICAPEQTSSIRVVWKLSITTGFSRPEFKVRSIVSFPRKLSRNDRRFTIRCLNALAAQRVYWSEHALCTPDIWAQVVRSYSGNYVAHTAWCAPNRPNRGGN